MLFETYDLPFSPQQSHLMLGALLGLAFGVLAQISRFCLRRGLVDGSDRDQALGTWLTALLVAIAAVQGFVWFGGLDLADHRFFAGEMPVLGILLGGLAFGAGGARIVNEDINRLI